jgi:hypothetical protein
MTLSLGRLPPSTPSAPATEHLLTVGPRFPAPQSLDAPHSRVSTSDPLAPSMAESTTYEAPKSIFLVAPTGLTVWLNTRIVASVTMLVDTYAVPRRQSSDSQMFYFSTHAYISYEKNNLHDFTFCIIFLNYYSIPRLDFLNRLKIIYDENQRYLIVNWFLFEENLLSFCV